MKTRRNKKMKTKRQKAGGLYARMFGPKTRSYPVPEDCKKKWWKPLNTTARCKNLREVAKLSADFDFAKETLPNEIDKMKKFIEIMKQFDILPIEKEVKKQINKKMLDDFLIQLKLFGESTMNPELKLVNLIPISNAFAKLKLGDLSKEIHAKIQLMTRQFITPKSNNVSPTAVANGSLEETAQRLSTASAGRDESTKRLSRSDSFASATGEERYDSFSSALGEGDLSNIDSPVTPLEPKIEKPAPVSPPVIVRPEQLSYMVGQLVKPMNKVKMNVLEAQVQLFLIKKMKTNKCPTLLYEFKDDFGSLLLKYIFNVDEEQILKPHAVVGTQPYIITFNKLLVLLYKILCPDDEPQYAQYQIDLFLAVHSYLETMTTTGQNTYQTISSLITGFFSQDNDSLIYYLLGDTSVSGYIDDIRNYFPIINVLDEIALFIKMNSSTTHYHVNFFNIKESAKLLAKIIELVVKKHAALLNPLPLGMFENLKERAAIQVIIQIIYFLQRRL